MAYWVDPSNRAVQDEIGTTTTIETAAVLGPASNLLSALTGYLVHPAGKVDEDFLGQPRIIRLTPTWRPIHQLIQVLVMDDCAVGEDIWDRFCIRAGDVWAKDRNTYVYPSRYRLACGHPGEWLRMRYEYGSTVGPMGRRAVLDLAHQFWLAENPGGTTGEEECVLPQRVTSVSREGVTFTITDPQEYLDKGRTGVRSVDNYLAAINPSRGLRPAGVWTPDQVPGVRAL